MLEECRHVNQPFTVTGRVLFVALLFSCLAVVDDSLVGFLSYLLWFLVITFLAGVYFRPSMRIMADGLPLFSQGDALNVTFTVANEGNRTAYDIHFHLPSVEGLEFSKERQVISHLPVGKNARISFQGIADRRGVFALPELTSGSLFPFSLFRFNGSYPLNEHVAVAPKFTDVDVSAFLNESGREDVDAPFPRRRRGRVHEYVGSREYQPGVPVQRWDFSSWARLGTPAVREFSEGAESLIVVVVETHVGELAQGRVDEQLEAVLSRAAAVVDLLTTNGQVALVLGPNEHDISAPNEQADPRRDLMTMLAGVNGQPTATDRNAVWARVAELFSGMGRFVAVVRATSKKQCVEAANEYEVHPVVITIGESTL